MSIPIFDVALEVSKLKSDPAKAANPANVEGRSATFAGDDPRFGALPPASQISNFSNFSSPPPPDGQGAAPPTTPDPKGSGLEWVTCPPEYDIEKYGGQWAALDLADFAKRYGLRVVRAEKSRDKPPRWALEGSVSAHGVNTGRILIVYQPDLKTVLTDRAESLLTEARPYLRVHLAELPILTPAEAAKAITDIMRRHPDLRFVLGEAGSLWPVYPKHWSVGQRLALQSLWFVAGDALTDMALARESAFGA